MWTPTPNYTLFLLILTIEIPAIKPAITPNVEIATTVLNIISTGTKGCASQVPGRVYTDGFEPKIILLNLFYMYIIATKFWLASKLYLIISSSLNIEINSISLLSHTL